MLDKRGTFDTPMHSSTSLLYSTDYYLAFHLLCVWFLISKPCAHRLRGKSCYSGVHTHTTFINTEAVPFLCNITAATNTVITVIHRMIAATDADILMIISVRLVIIEHLVVPIIVIQYLIH